MVAHDTGHRLCLEERIHGSDELLFDLCMRDSEPKVLQCPAMSYMVHEVPADCVVFAMRHPADIRKSQARTYHKNGTQVRWYRVAAQMQHRYAADGTIPMP